MENEEPSPVFRKLDCYSLLVDDLDEGIRFYGKLGHKLLWRGNPLPILDFSKGKLATDADGNVVGNQTSPAENPAARP